MKDFIKHFNSKLELYCYRIYWGIHTQNVESTCDVVTGHLSFVVTLTLGLVGFLLSPFVPPINIDGLGLDDLEIRRIVFLSIFGVVAYILIIRPVGKYVEKVFTQESIDRIGAVKSYTKLQINLFKIYILFFYLFPLSIFAIAAILIRDYYWTLPIFQ